MSVQGQKRSFRDTPRKVRSWGKSRRKYGQIGRTGDRGMGEQRRPRSDPLQQAVQRLSNLFPGEQRPLHSFPELEALSFSTDLPLRLFGCGAPTVAARYYQRPAHSMKTGPYVKSLTIIYEKTFTQLSYKPLFN